MKLRELVGVVGMAFVACACGDSAGPASTIPDTQDAADSATADGADAALPDSGLADAPELSEVVLRVVSVDPVSLTGQRGGEWEGYDPGFVPAAEVRVSIERPDGSRAEVSTNADGIAVLADVDWSAGKLAFTAYKPGYSLWSDEILPGTAETTAVLWSLENPTTVTVQGQLIGASAARSSFVAASTSHSYSSEIGTGFQLEVPVGKPFSVVGTQIGDTGLVGWYTTEHDAVTEPSTVSLDLAPTVPRRTSGTIVPPDRADSPLRTSAFAQVLVGAFDDTLLVGGNTMGYPSTNGATLYEAEHVELAGASDVRTSFSFTSPSFGFTSTVGLEGYPTDGTVVEGFLDMPDFIAPQNPDAVMSVLDPIEWIPREPTDAQLIVWGKNQRPLWLVTARGNVSSIRVPRLPDGVDPVQLLGTQPLAVNLLLLADYRPQGPVMWWKSLAIRGYKMTL